MAELAQKIQTKTAPAAPYMHWLVRIGLAGVFAYHGFSKLAGGTPPQAGLDMMFFGSAAVFWLVALAETAAGLGILLGGLKFAQAELVTRASALAIAVIMTVAALTVHLPAWNFMEGGAEFQVLTALVSYAIAVRGSP